MFIVPAAWYTEGWIALGVAGVLGIIIMVIVFAFLWIAGKAFLDRDE